MHLPFKIYNYIRLRNMGVRNAWVKSPLTTTDYYLITWIIAAILLAIAYTWRVEIDNAKLNYAIKHAQERSQRVKSDADMQRYELIIVSMLNGSVMIDDRLKTICVINAAGLCEF